MSFFTDGRGKKIDIPDDTNWYHGSPEVIDILAAGSSITRNKQLAIAFSHKPSMICIDDEGGLSHDGECDGYLYVIDEPVNADDIYAHQACEKDDLWEWITRRPLKVKKIEDTRVVQR